MSAAPTPAAADGGSPLSRPIHRLPLAPGAPAWRDNAFLLFWDPAADVYGSAHVSTSPNAEGRRARFSVTAGGRTRELIEPLAAGSFAGELIAFDVHAGTVTVRAPEISADLQLTPRFVHADYAAGGIFPSLDAAHPVQHYQQGVSVTGVAVLAGEEHPIDAHGLRDRTWGYRDEAVSMSEYVALVASFPSRTLTMMRMRTADGTDRSEGYLLSDHAEPLSGFGVTRDAAGFLVAAHLGEPDELTVTVIERRAGFWVPMGAQRRGPTIRAYDEFVALQTSDGEHGFGVVEQATVHQLY